MVESGLYHMWRKLQLKKYFIAKEFYYFNQNDANDFKAVDIKLISTAVILSLFFMISSIIVFVLEIIIFFYYVLNCKL